MKSSFGYHIIRLTALKAAAVMPFAQVKERIRQQLTGQRLKALVEEKTEAFAAALRGGQSLEDAARAQGFTAQKSAPLGRADVKPPLTSPALLARAFELKKGEHEPQPFPLPPETPSSRWPTEAARLPDLKEVQDKVKADLLRSKALEKARAVAADLRQRAEGEGLDKAAVALGLTRKETPALVGHGQPLGDLGTSATLEETAFALARGVLSDPTPTPNGYAVLRVTDKKDFDPAAFEKEKASVAVSLREERKQQLFRSYMEEARKRFPVERHPRP